MRLPSIILLIMITASLPGVVQGQKKPLTLEDRMRFKSIESPVLSLDGSWVAFTAQPDRGDPEVVVVSTSSNRKFTIPRASSPLFSSDGRWLAASRVPPAVELEKKEKDKDKPKNGLILLPIPKGDTVVVQNVQSFTFSENSRWLAMHLHTEGKSKDTLATPPADSSARKEPRPRKNIGTTLLVRDLTSGATDTLLYVAAFAFDSLSHHLAYVVADSFGHSNGVYLRKLDDRTTATLARDSGSVFNNLSWHKTRSQLAFLGARSKDGEKTNPATMFGWHVVKGRTDTIAPATSAGRPWMIPSKNNLAWSRDGIRLFFGTRPSGVEPQEDTTKESPDMTFFDVKIITKKAGLDVWHWDDPLINSHQKKRWNDFKDHSYRAVFDVESGSVVQLADSTLPDVRISENPSVVLGTSDVPYRKLITWEDTYRDAYLVSLRDGTRTLVVEKMKGSISLSPDGRFVVYYKDKHWHLFSRATGLTTNLTKSIHVPFYDEENDHPAPPGEYGFAGWMNGDSAVLLYDRYDIWLAPTDGKAAVCITDQQGRRGAITHRIVNLDKELRFYTPCQHLLLTAFHDKKKYRTIAHTRLGSKVIVAYDDASHLYTFLAQSKTGAMILFERESYNEFPDLWVTTPQLRSHRKLTEVNPQIKEFAWGSPELVEWLSADGKPLQGVLIKPGNYEKGKRYPVLVYFYEISSHRLFEFNPVVINHRPSFPYFASHGYAILLPDVRFDVGHPGQSAVKCIVPGVQKLIDMGVADPKAIGLHGHSWGGYQTAYMVTQTNMFAAAIAGAPVANMTSAYSGIRWGTGLARQWQYEMYQSRIGGSLWEYPERYIENSPVFFADRVNTPLLIQFGDEDEAVPWYQGIEMYLALRRLGKESVFLQYRGEPHHLKKYANKMDYTIKFKEFLDHYLKGMPAPEWLKEGVKYGGE